MRLKIFVTHCRPDKKSRPESDHEGQTNEWVSISDLMAGVMAVVMLLLVVSVLQNQFAELKRQEEKNKTW